jgi:NAD(P)-dependent dehydrogenase (short-subunit alcohol dehydrogenase family)
MSSTRKVVLVTGAAKRIGREIALGFAKAGWDVAVHYATSREAATATADQIARFGVQSYTFNRDLAVEAGVETLVPEVIGQLGRIDCLVNNASIYEHDVAENFSYAALEKHWRINVAAPMALTRALARHTPDGAQACAIQLLDQKLQRLDPDYLSYTVSKAGLAAATTMLAQALAPKLRVVGIAPGLSLPSGSQTPETFQHAHAQTLLGRGSQPEDVARACVFVAESPAITGTTLVVDGGQHLTGKY